MTIIDLLRGFSDMTEKSVDAGAAALYGLAPAQDTEQAYAEETLIPWGKLLFSERDRYRAIARALIAALPPPPEPRFAGTVELGDIKSGAKLLAVDGRLLLIHSDNSRSPSWITPTGLKPICHVEDMTND